MPFHIDNSDSTHIWFKLGSSVINESINIIVAGRYGISVINAALGEGIFSSYSVSHLIGKAFNHSYLSSTEKEITLEVFPWSSFSGFVFLPFMGMYLSIGKW